VALGVGVAVRVGEVVGAGLDVDVVGRDDVDAGAAGLLLDVVARTVGAAEVVVAGALVARVVAVRGAVRLVVVRVAEPWRGASEPGVE
jgi:hypothetical protein